MLLPAQGPNTTLMEDFDILGLSEANKADPSTSPPQVKGSKEKGGDYVDPPGDKKPGDPGGDVDLEDGADGKGKGAGHYTYVPVRGDEDVGPKGKYGSSRGGAKNEEVEETVNGKMVPSFMVPTQEEVEEAEQQTQQEAEQTQLVKAWEVINAYFTEDEDGLNEEGLRGVINAMGFALNTCIEDIATLSGENVRLTEAVNDLNRILKESEISEAKACPTAEEPYGKGEEEEEEEEGKKEESAKTPANLTEDKGLKDLLNELDEIGGKSKAVDAQSKLIEGFETVMNGCSEIVERVVKVMRDEAGIAEDDELEVDEDDPRYQVASFFHSIAEDSQNYLTRLADGDVAFRVAEEDLARLHQDMEKGIKAMGSIE
ncbi:MAG: hypothetical protein ACYTFG_20840 [Planctomycetota bacterium]|jgi:hypothetical protein